MPAGVGYPPVPGINWTQVTPAERARLSGLIEHYRKKPHPFTACVRDNRDRFGPERAKRICAVLKDLIEGGTHWRGKDRSMAEDRPLDREETRALIEMAEAIRDSGERAYFDPMQPRAPAGGAGGGRWKAGGAPTSAKKKDAKPRRTVKWAGREMTREQLVARLGETGVPVEAWAWRHKAMARRIGIPVPASEPTAALRKLNAKLSAQAAERKKGKARRGAVVGARGAAMAAAFTRKNAEGGESREFEFNPGQKRAPRGRSRPSR